MTHTAGEKKWFQKGAFQRKVDFAGQMARIAFFFQKEYLIKWWAFDKVVSL